MKKLILLILLMVFSVTAPASIICGIKPIVPIGCDDMICIDGQWKCINYNKSVGM